MKVEACMSTDIRIASPAQPIRDAARTMKEIDAGFLPVGENDRLVGIVTDRDIIVRALAEGKGDDPGGALLLRGRRFRCNIQSDGRAESEAAARSQCQQAANRDYSHSGTSCRPAMTTKLGRKTR